MYQLQITEVMTEENTGPLHSGPPDLWETDLVKAGMFHFRQVVVPSHQTSDSILFSSEEREYLSV